MSIFFKTPRYPGGEFIRFLYQLARLSITLGSFLGECEDINALGNSLSFVKTFLDFHRLKSPEKKGVKI